MGGSGKSKSYTQPQPRHESRYFSPRDLVQRWRCSRSTVDRIARREGLTRLLLGEGRHGIVRFLRDEVEQLETSRLVGQDD
ncbi:MAG: hypothetical protein IT365_04410 [Candidatus Hydrogenedentes bacterium]|nr:hypothetical protein [Candidatus Hydrogenedentota bacterium]